MKKVILFDLDGTLLPLDTNDFVNHYIKELAPRVAHIMDPNKFVDALLTGTKAMLTNFDPNKTNEQVFEESFLGMIDIPKEDLWPTLDHFYEKIFPTFSYLSKPTVKAKQVVEAAINNGFRVGIATNPVFPKTAIYHRLNWAGIDNLPFDIVTVFEESAYTKPHVEYYKEICARLEVQPNECMMVGNDIQEDMVASLIGMKTFLVEGYVIDRGSPKYQINDRGTLDDLFKKITKREGIFS